MIGRGTEVRILLFAAFLLGSGPAGAGELFCPVSSDLMRFREELLTEVALAKTVEALRAGLADPAALLQQPTQAKLESMVYLSNSQTIIEGFRLRSQVLHKQAAFELRRTLESDEGPEATASAGADFQQARDALCEYLKRAKYAQ